MKISQSFVKKKDVTPLERDIFFLTNLTKQSNKTSFITLQISDVFSDTYVKTMLYLCY
jgi:hypothetical protein